MVLAACSVSVSASLFAQVDPVKPRAVATPEFSPPNLVLILTDDQGWADVGFNGCQDIPTPNIDRIANEGVRCAEGYVSYSVCGPSRAGLLTGRYQDRFGFCRNPSINPEDKAGIPLTEETIADILGRAGYQNGIMGKWHMGTHPTLHPLERGFHEFYGFLSGGHRYFPEELTLQDLSEVDQKWGWYQTKLLRNHERVETDEYLTDELSNEAVSFIDRHHDRPFFLYLAYNAPHTPLQATDKYLDRFPNIEDPKRKTYAAMVSAVDDGVGHVLAKLDEKGLAEQTLVFYLSDNGGATNNASLNQPLRGHKGSFYEGGMRVPYAVRWPGQIPGGMTYQQPVSSLDILATIAELAGVQVSDDRPLDGVNLIPFFKGEKTGAPHRELFWRSADKGVLSIRRSDEKLILNSDASVEHFNLRADLSEKTNLAESEMSQAAKELETTARSWGAEMKAPAFPGLGNWDPSKPAKK